MDLAVPKIVELPLALVPSAAKGPGKPKWRQVVCTNSLVNITGGFCNQNNVATSIDLQVQSPKGEVTQTFIKLDKNAQWFLKGTGGDCVQKGSLRAVTVLDEIRKEMADPTADVAAEDTPDPMDRLQAIVEAPRKANAKAKGAPKRQPLKSSVVQVRMPMRPLCAAPTSTDSRIIDLYRGPSVKSKPNCNWKQQVVYVRSDHISWLLAYAADQLYFQGVEPPSSTPPQSRAPNCDEVAGLHVSWIFNVKQWEATFVSGPCAHETRTLGPSDIDRAMWRQLQESYANYGDYDSYGMEQKKMIAKDVLVRGCKSIANGWSDAFTSMLGAGHQGLETPPKKPRHAAPDAEDDPSAAVAEELTDDDADGDEAESGDADGDDADGNE